MTEGAPDAGWPAAELVSFAVRDFKALRDARLDFEPDVTVLVGRNDVGKSTVLEALFAYGMVVRSGGFRTLYREVPPRFDATWRRGDELWEHGQTFDPRAPAERLRCGDRFWDWNPRTRELKTDLGVFQARDLPRLLALGQIGAERWRLDTDVPEAVFGPLAVLAQFGIPQPYRFEPTALQRPAPLALEQPQPTGLGWTMWMQAIVNRRDAGLSSLEQVMRGLFPFFGELRLREQRVHIEQSVVATPPDPLSLPDPADEPLRRELETQATRLLYVRAPSPEAPWVAASELSSGLLLTLAHLALVYGTDDTRLLLLEEPENGLNPKITLEMMRALLAAATARKRQLLITTHNAWWLDLIPRRAIRVLTRDVDGAKISRPDPEELDELLGSLDAYPSELVNVYGPEGLLMHGRGGDSG